MHVFQIHSYSIAALQVVCAAMWVSGRACCNLLRVLLGPDWFLPHQSLARTSRAGCRWPGLPHAAAVCLVPVSVEPV